MILYAPFQLFIEYSSNEACILVLGTQDICHFTSRDMGYYPFYFQGYGRRTSIFLFTFRDIGYLGKLIIGIFEVYKGYLRGAFGKFLAWSFISVTDLQTLLCLVTF